MNVHADFEGAEHAVHDALQFQHTTLRAPSTDSGHLQLCLSALWLTPGASNSCRWKRRRAHEHRVLLRLMAWATFRQLM